MSTNSSSVWRLLHLSRFDRLCKVFLCMISFFLILLLVACPSEMDDAPSSIVITDPLYKYQWHLFNDGSEGKKKGIDINVLPVWAKGHVGKGVNVGVIDEGFDPWHPDLKENFPESNLFYKKADSQPGVGEADPQSRVGEADPQSGKCISHGSRVMGVMAARDNKTGVRGIAHRANFYGYDFSLMRSFRSFDVTEFFEDLSRDKNLSSIAVWNMSWGNNPESYYYQFSDKRSRAFDVILEDGFHGRGPSLVVGAGNLYSKDYILLIGGNASNSDNNNHYGVIAVNAIGGDGELPAYSSYSPGHTVGTNIWVIAPEGGKTTYNTACRGDKDYPGDYFSISKTSGAAPMVSGVIALLRGAYPLLTWRDVKLIIAESARKIKPVRKAGFISSGYQPSGRMYHDSQKEQSYHRLAGFGLVDAGKAFEIAEDWDLLPPMKTGTYSKTHSPPLDTSAEETEYTTSLQVSGSEINFVESLTLEIEITPPANKSLWLKAKLILASPDGKKAYFYDFQANSDNFHGYSGERALLDQNDTSLILLTNRFLGYPSPDGTWTLSLEHFNDADKIAITEIKSWKITIRGH